LVTNNQSEFLNHIRPLLVRPSMLQNACISMVICEICLVNQKKFYL
jgi:hypothetical protein